jgi:WXG100 family type VII secretion target
MGRDEVPRLTGRGTKIVEGVFSYDEAVADSAHGDLAAVTAGLQAHLDDLSGFVARVKSNWTGDEQETYGGIQTKWDSAAETVKQILGSVHQALGTTTSSVKDMRGQVRSALQSH